MTNPYDSPAEARQYDPIGNARAKLLTPAVALIVVSVLWIFFALMGLAFFYWQQLTSIEEESRHTFFMMILGVEVLYSLVLITGAFSMLRRGSYVWAVVTNLLALVPILSPFYFLGIPFGVWGLWVLRNPEVKAAFRGA